MGDIEKHIEGIKEARKQLSPNYNWKFLSYGADYGFEFESQYGIIVYIKDKNL